MNDLIGIVAAASIGFLAAGAGIFLALTDVYKVLAEIRNALKELAK